MGSRIGVHRADDAQIVRKPGSMGEQAADLHPALTVLREPERRFHQVADRTAVGADRRLSAVGCPVVPRQCGFVVEGVDLARAPFMNKKTTRFALAGKWLGLGESR